MNNLERLQEIKQEFVNLMKEARQIVKKSCTPTEYESAKRWINKIDDGIDGMDETFTRSD